MNFQGFQFLQYLFTPAGNSSKVEPEAKLRDVRKYLKKHSHGKSNVNDSYFISFLYAITRHSFLDNFLKIIIKLLLWQSAA